MTPALWISLGSLFAALVVPIVPIVIWASGQAEKQKQAGLELWGKQQAQLDTMFEERRQDKDTIMELRRENHNLRAEVQQMRDRDALRKAEIDGLRGRVLELERQRSTDNAGSRLDDLEQHNRDHPRPDPDEPTT